MVLDWGNVPVWVGSVLTGTSLLIAALAYRRSVADREMAQASKVFAWLHRERGKYELVVRNGSDLPIFQCEALFPDEKDIRLGTIPPGTTQSCETMYLSKPSMMLSFIDATNHLWMRNPLGELVKAPRYLRRDRRLLGQLALKPFNINYQRYVDVMGERRESRRKSKARLRERG